MSAAAVETIVAPPPLLDVENFELDCPTCGTLGVADPGQRDSAAFCRVCDYPLFWARERVLMSTTGDDADASLRRLPGTGGRTVLANITCPVCTELNSATATHCRRCGSDLYPVAPELPPEPEPVFEAPALPEPEKRRWWPWVLAAITIALLIALFVILTVYGD